MITAEWKPIPEIVDKLRGHKKILVVGCATCVAECAAGGEREVETMAPLLRMAMANDGDTIEIHTKTLERQCEWEFVEELAPEVTDVDAIVSMACGIGVQALAERFSDIPVYPAVNTTTLAIREEPGLWTTRCLPCGDCVLGETFGLCPIARCAKNIMNGPCGGTRDGGKCEINEDIDCVWYLIHERAKARGQLDTLLEIKKAKQWCDGAHGGPKRIVREDLRI